LNKESDYINAVLTLLLVFSSYYDAPVHVIVRRCERRTSEGCFLAIWDRTVDLTVYDQVIPK